MHKQDSGVLQELASVKALPPLWRKHRVENINVALTSLKQSRKKFEREKGDWKEWTPFQRIAHACLSWSPCVTGNMNKDLHAMFVCTCFITVFVVLYSSDDCEVIWWKMSCVKVEFRLPLKACLLQWIYFAFCCLRPGWSLDLYVQLLLKC